MIRYDGTNETWKRALKRSLDLRAGRATRFVDAYAGFPDSTKRYVEYEVSSVSAPGHKYRVLVRFWNGTVGVSCNCPAGENGKPCYHAVTAVSVTDYQKLKMFWSEHNALLRV